MHLSTQSRMASCPYCGEPGEFIIDPSLPSQQYVEDCYVCCQPILVTVEIDGDDIHLSLHREDDA
jgi:hypothetical protein